MKRIVIVGAGTAGTTMANRLARLLPASWQIFLLDRDDVHVYQPGLLFLPFGAYRDDELTRPRTPLVDPRVRLRLGEIERIAVDERRVYLGGGETLSWDHLILATGSRIVPEATPGLTEAGWHSTGHDFYTLAGAHALRAALDRFTGGRIVINIAELPIKCPVAPLEFAFLADAYFTQRGLRDKVELVYATPLEGAFTKPVASRLLGGMLTARGIDVVGDFAVSGVDGHRRRISSYDGRELDYDLLVSIPSHAGSCLLYTSRCV